MRDAAALLAAAEAEAGRTRKTWVSVDALRLLLAGLPESPMAEADTVLGLGAQAWHDTAVRYFRGLGAIAHVDDKRDTVASLRAIALFYRGEGPLVEHVVRNADGTLTVLRPSPDDPAPAPPRRTPLSDAAPGNP